MPNPNYLRSTDGVDTDSGATWALANATIAGAIADSTAGDRIFISQAHNESAAAAITMTFPGTMGNPNQAICASDAAEPPTTLAGTAVISSPVANGHITINGSVLFRGVTFKSGAGGSNGNLSINQTGSHYQRYENCVMSIDNSHAASGAGFGGGSSNPGFTDFKDTFFNFGNTAHSITLAGKLAIFGGGFSVGSASPSSGIFNIGAIQRDGNVTIENLDFSTLAASTTILKAAGATNSVVTITGAILPASWTGSLITSPITNPGFRAEMYNSKSGSTRILEWVETGYGTIRDSQTVFRTGGSALHGTAYSLKMTAGANCKYPAARMESNRLFRQYPGNAAEDSAFVAGATKTVKVQIAHDIGLAAGQGAGTGFRFTNEEIALEVRVLDSAGNETTTLRSSLPATILSTATDVADSSAAWTTTGMTTPQFQELRVDVAPQVKGRIIAQVVFYKTGKVVHVCGKLEVA